MKEKSSPRVRIEVLEKKHERTQFDCGIESLNRYLKENARQEQQRRSAAVFVLVHEGEQRVLGYYTLSQCSLLLSDLPNRLHKKLPRYPQVPASLLGRLAVDQTCRGLGACVQNNDQSRLFSRFVLLLEAPSSPPASTGHW